jgi:hypothetical protein
VNGDGKELLSDYVVVGRRNDGSEVKSIDRHIGDRSHQLRVVSDPVARKKTIIDFETSSRTTYKLAPEEIAVAGCSGGSTGETSTILGFNVRRITKEQVVQDRLVRRESWVSPDLNCIPLKQTVTVTQNGKLTATTTRRMLSVAMEEPSDPKLYEIPSYLVERRPSEVISIHREKMAALGTPRCENCSTKITETLEHRDLIYDSRKADH